MKKFICSALCLITVFSSCVTVCAVDEKSAPKVSAEAYVLYCADNGEVLLSQNENKRMKPASTTKLMTTLITLEQAASCDKKVTFTQEMTAEGSSMYLKVGEQVKLSDLAVGMMMSSGNDAANAASLTIGKTTEGFAELMNERAKQIGMSNTHFVTPSGLDDDNHYSTAYDLALLMSYALENEDFAKLTAQKSAAVEFVKPESKRTVYSNHNRLLSLYEYCIGGKTGYTKAAGRCLVSAAKKDGLTLVCVTLNDGNDWNDHISLYEYGFDNYAYFASADTDFCVEVPCVGSDKNAVVLSGESNAGAVIKAEDRDKVKRRVYCDSFLYAPIQTNEVCGRIEYSVDGEIIASVNLTASENVSAEAEKKSIWKSIKELFTYG